MSEILAALAAMGGFWGCLWGLAYMIRPEWTTRKLVKLFYLVTFQWRTFRALERSDEDLKREKHWEKRKARAESYGTDDPLAQAFIATVRALEVVTLFGSELTRPPGSLDPRPGDRLPGQPPSLGDDINRMRLRLGMLDPKIKREVMLVLERYQHREKTTSLVREVAKELEQVFAKHGLEPWKF